MALGRENLGVDLIFASVLLVQESSVSQISFESGMLIETIYFDTVLAFSTKCHALEFS
jgi:hypothetical protein